MDVISVVFFHPALPVTALKQVQLFEHMWLFAAQLHPLKY